MTGSKKSLKLGNMLLIPDAMQREYWKMGIILSDSQGLPTRGADLISIQRLPIHKCLRTTGIYTHLMIPKDNRR